MLTPKAERTSDEPLLLVTLRLPCLATSHTGSCGDDGGRLADIEQLAADATLSRISITLPAWCESTSFAAASPAPRRRFRQPFRLCASASHQQQGNFFFGTSPASSSPITSSIAAVERFCPATIWPKYDSIMQVHFSDKRICRVLRNGPIKNRTGRYCPS